MKDRPPTNLPASIHQRLLNVSKKSGRPFNDLDQIKELVGNVCTVDVEADGLVFESESVVTIRIVEDTDHRVEIDSSRKLKRNWRTLACSGSLRNCLKSLRKASAE